MRLDWTWRVVFAALVAGLVWSDPSSSVSIGSVLAQTQSEVTRKAPPLPAGFLRTSIATDLAINGRGFFLVRDPATDERFLTRVGRFQVDRDGFLMAMTAFRLQGFNVPIPIEQTYGADAPIGDIRIDKGEPPSSMNLARYASIQQVTISSEGNVNMLFNDGSQYLRGQIVLLDTDSVEGLVSRWTYFYNAGTIDWSRSRPLPPARGTIISGALESSAFAFDFGKPAVLVDRAQGQTEVFAPYAGLMTVVQASSDLIRWTSVRTNATFGISSIRFVDAAARGRNERFYRTIAPAIQQTGRATDLAIRGRGHFVVKNAENDTEFVTRSGAFQIGAADFLVTPDGYRLQGYNTPIESNREYPENSVIGDLRLDGSDLTGVSRFSIDRSGKITLFLANGTHFTRGQILLREFDNPFALEKAGEHLFRNVDAALPNPRFGKPGQSALGTIVSGALTVPPEIESD